MESARVRDFGVVYEIERVSATNELDFWYFTNDCENPVQSAFHAVICLFDTYWDFFKPPALNSLRKNKFLLKST